MAETRGVQEGFEWAGEGEAASRAEPAAVPGPARKATPKAPGAVASGRTGPARARTAGPRAAQPGGPPAEPLPPDNELWDVHAAARFLRRSVSWVYHRAEDGSLPVKRLGGWGLRFIPGELRAWVESGGVAPARRRE